MGLNGGSNSSSSKPLSPFEMQMYYNFAAANIFPSMPQGNSYVAPAYQGTAPKTLTGGDYDALQKSIYDSQAAGLDSAWNKRKAELGATMGKKGLWNSGLAVKAEGDEYGNNFAPLYLKAANDAVTQRYGLQSNELNNVNQYMLHSYDTLNSMNMANAGKVSDDQWRRAEFLANLWNGGKGQTSNSSGFNIGFNI